MLVYLSTYLYIYPNQINPNQNYSTLIYLSTSLSLFLFVSLSIYTHTPLYTLGQTNLDLENPWFPVKIIYTWWGKPHKFKFTLG